MGSLHPSNWRQWVWADRHRPRVRRTITWRSVQTFIIFGLLLFAVSRVFSSAGPVREVGHFDHWPFWLEEARSGAVATVSTLWEDRGEAIVVLGLINRPDAPGAEVVIDGQTVASFTDWKVILPVSAGDTIAVVLPEESEPVRIRVIASSGIRTPRLGREWSLVQGEVILGSVSLRE